MWFHQSSEPPSPCRCGGEVRGKVCTEVGVTNHWNFPPFCLLPSERDIDETYYEFSELSGGYTASRHWGIVSEIEEAVFFVRPRVSVRTLFDESKMVHFYLDTPTPTFFDWDALTKGSTLVILYPIRHFFLDMTEGIRQENPNTVMVFPVSMRLLLKEIRSHISAPLCFSCESKTDAPKRCAKCKLAYYCGRDCQVKHWKDAHRKLCGPLATMLSKFAKIDFDSFEDYTNWGFPTARPHQVQQELFAQERNASLRRLGIEPLSKLGRLEHLLDSIRNKVLMSDPISRRLLDEFGGSIVIGPHVTDDNLVSESFLFQALEGLVASPHRVHVIDLRADGPITEQQNSAMLDILFFAIPQWQTEAGLLNMAWAFESHCFTGTAGERAFPGAEWETTASNDAIDGLTVSNRCSRAFCADNVEIVASISEALAETTEDVVIRVLRATGNESYEETIRELATRAVSENIYTVWIREDIGCLGRFNPPRNELNLTDQLLDVQPVDMISMMQRMANLSASKQPS